MKVIPLNMTISKSLKSRAMVIAYFSLAFGAFLGYTAVFKEVSVSMDLLKEAGTYIGAAIAIIGIRDK